LAATIARSRSCNSCAVANPIDGAEISTITPAILTSAAAASSARRRSYSVTAPRPRICSIGDRGTSSRISSPILIVSTASLGMRAGRVTSA